MMDSLVPISLFFALAFCIVAPVYFNYRGRIKELETLSKLAESNDTMRTEILQFMRRPSSPQSELRKGLILLAIAIPIIVGGLVDGTVMVSIVLGGIPLLVGLAYVYMAKSIKTTERD